MPQVRKTKRAKSGGAGQINFHAMLIPAQWVLSFFERGDFEYLRSYLDREDLGEINPETGNTRYFHALADGTLFNMNRVSKECFAQYDMNIIKHWKSITKKRNRENFNKAPLKLKYFQYLSLLATELYLDWYFNHREDLLKELNEQLTDYLSAHKGDSMEPFSESDLRKVAFWEATGAGKTLLMHVNVLQYLSYAKEANNLPDRIILLTPNEDLSRQHIQEFEDSFAHSNLHAELMDETELFRAQGVDRVFVVDSHKLISDESQSTKGEKRFYAASFEGNNLVLVDEGHHGSSKIDGEHRRTREQLCRDGFCFEYSATFGQAVHGGAQVSKLRAEYAKSILFDYSYRYFHDDGYGKEAFILNIENDNNEEDTFRYLCANLLIYYQQHLLYSQNKKIMQVYGIDKPLCIFVGTTVNTENSDVQRIVKFLADFLGKRADAESIISSLLRNEDVLLAGARNPLHNRFAPLMGKTASDIYADILTKIFNTSDVGTLHVDLDNSTSEITLSVGNAEHPFALISIGSPDAFIKLLENDKSLNNDNRLVVRNKEIGRMHGYFDELNAPDSKITFLVGARKFIMGWSCWRVSCMGLMNFGRNEGTQVIQLFGRGVRLRGKNFSLKRSTLDERRTEASGAYLDYLETLQIFGIRADYMKTFKEYLEAEGIQTQDQVLALHFPIKKKILNTQLIVPQVKDGYHLNQAKGFKTKKVSLFELPPESKGKIKDIVVKYDDFCHIRALRTDPTERNENTQAPDDVKLDKKAFPFFDWDSIYLDLIEIKGQRGYSNLLLSKEKLIGFANGNDSWYQLYAREEDVQFSDFTRLQNIERLFKVLLSQYVDKFYKTLQDLFEDEHRVQGVLNENWIPSEYCFELENSDDGRVWETRLKALSALVAEQEIPMQEVNKWMQSCPVGFVVITFDRHIYTPLFFQDGKAGLPFSYKPLSLGAESEERFVCELQKFYHSKEGEPYFKDVDLYLMRNASNKLHGIGFAQAGNFYPDFLMWLVDKTNPKKQYLTFIDPKGLRNIPFDGSKLNFASEIKNLQKTINEGAEHQIVLNSVILSDTSIDDPLLHQHTLAEYAQKNIFFLDDGPSVYLPQLFKAAKQED